VSSLYSKSDAIAMLQNLIESGRPLKDGKDGPAVDLWHDAVRVALRELFGEKSQRIDGFERIDFAPMMVRNASNPAAWEHKCVQARAQGMFTTCNFLAMCINEISATWRDPNEPTPDWNALARDALKVLHDIYEHSGSVLVYTSAETVAEHLGIKLQHAVAAFEKLERKGWAKGGGPRQWSPTDEGVELWEDQAEVDRVLPVERAAARPSGGGLPKVDVPALAKHLVFVQDDKLRAVIASDLGELKDAAERGNPKTIMMLAGSVLEAAILDVLQRRADLVTPFFPKKKFPDEWSLPQLLEVGSKELKTGLTPLLTESAKKDAMQVTDHRDLIHPHRCVRMNVRVDLPTATMMLTLVWRVLADLHAAHDRGDLKAFEVA
jgi:hypothetical protein